LYLEHRTASSEGLLDFPKGRKTNPEGKAGINVVGLGRVTIPERKVIVV
jgi:hypothetical protein